MTVIRPPQTQRTTNPPIFEYLCILSQQQVPRNGRKNGGALDRRRFCVCRAQSKAVVYLFVRKMSKQTSYCKHYLLFQAARSTPLSVPCSREHSQCPKCDLRPVSLLLPLMVAHPPVLTPTKSPTAPAIISPCRYGHFQTI